MLSLCAVRRTQLASDDLFKSACAQVKNVRGVKKVKNISEDAFGTKLGRIHVPAQEISKIQVHPYTASWRVDTENVSKMIFLSLHLYRYM
jgi:hypothetical protein